MSNDRLTDDVRRALAAGALSADPTLVDLGDVYGGITRRRRRRLAVASTVGVIALLGAGGAFALQRSGHTTARVAADPTPSADGRVPWLALPAPSAPASPAPTTPATARECGASDVSFSSLETDGAAGTLYNNFIVKNISASDCTLSGSPGVSVAGSGGGDVRHESTLVGFGVTPATIAPGAEARVALATSMNCQSTVSTYSGIELILKDGHPLATHESLQSTCGVRVSDWYLAPGDPTPTPYSSLTAFVEGAPLAVDPGATLDYTVVLQNPGDTPVKLDPCPGYHEYATDGVHSTDHFYGLNCTAEGAVIPAGGQVRYQMKIDIPEGLTHPTKFFWILGNDASSYVVADALMQPATPAVSTP